MIAKLQYISKGVTPQEHLENIQKACASGVEWIQLQLEHVKKKDVLETAKKAREITGHFQTRLIIKDYYKIAAEIKADGVYFENLNDYSKSLRKDLASWQIVGAQAHTLDDCQKLLNKEVDYIALGPFRSAEKELGEKGLLAILSELKTDMPIIAKGGIKLNDVLDIVITGVYGIAVSKEITHDFNKISKFKELINGGAMQEQRWEPRKD